MSDLIDRQSLVNSLNRFAPEHYSALINLLVLKEPAVDAVRVTRCKDCDHWVQVPWLPSDRRVCAKTNNTKRPYSYCDEAETTKGNDFQQYLDEIGVREG